MNEGELIGPLCLGPSHNCTYVIVDWVVIEDFPHATN